MDAATSRPKSMAPVTADEGRPADDPGLLDRVVEATRYTVRDVEVMAKKAAQSHLFGMDEAQAFTLMLLCEAEGLHPIQALRRFDIVDGKPTLKAATIQAEFQRHGGRIEWGETTSEVCEATFSHARLHPNPLLVRITLQELIDSGVALGKRDERTKERTLKANYQRHPRSMLRARVISEGVRAIDPGIVVGLYTSEEISDLDDPRPVPRARPAPKVPSQPAQSQAPRKAVKGDRTHGKPGPPPSEAWLWMKQEMSRRWDTWAGICAIDHLDPGRKIRINHALNHLVKKWAEEGRIEEADYKDEHGKQDNDKVAAVVRNAWALCQAIVRADFTDFLRDDIRSRAADRGIELDDDPDWDMTEPTEPEPAGDGDTWEDGRE